MNKCLCLLILCGLCLLSACRDNDEAFRHDSSDQLVTVDRQQLLFESQARYNRFTVDDRVADAVIGVRSSGSDWLTLISDTLASDGIVEFYTEANDETERRSTVLTFFLQDDPLRTTEIEVVQKGRGENDENVDDDPLSDFRVGWGFNAFDEYKSQRSICKKIIDVNRLKTFDSDTTFNAVQEILRGQETFDYKCAYSLQEISSLMTGEMTEQTKILGVKKTVHRFSSVSEKRVNEQSYGYARLQKTVASRSIDAGVITYLTSDKEVIARKRLPFTSDFYTVYDKINAASGKDRETLIDKMLLDYGTHLVIDASVGCMIDYVICFDKRTTDRLEQSTSEQSKYVFGKMKKNELTQDLARQVTSKISHNNSFHIEGGSNESRKALEDAIGHMQSGAQISSDLLYAWMATASATVLNDPEQRKNLNIVDYNFIPIWELFADKTVRAMILEKVNAMSEQSNNAFTENELGIDNYLIDLREHGLRTFKDDENATLVKVLYGKDVPLIEVCNEYVPKLRTDKRVTVFYPIRNGRTDIGQGIFPGDGEGNTPAFLTFSGGEVYVNPIKGMGYYDIIDSLYYLNGNLYVESYGIKVRTLVAPKVVEQYFNIKASKFTYPIVKIGSGYWTRSCIQESMGFGFTRYGSFQVREKVLDNVLYANIFDSNKPLFLANNKSEYGKATDDIYHKRILWYLPVATDRESLVTYLGRNLKSAFKGQVAGFDASFLGYYDNAGKKVVDKDVCYIAFKEMVDANTGEVMKLMKDYTWEKVSIGWNNKYYPVRMFRTNYYQYK